MPGPSFQRAELALREAKGPAQVRVREAQVGTWNQTQQPTETRTLSLSYSSCALTKHYRVSTIWLFSAIAKLEPLAVPFPDRTPSGTQP